MNCKNSRQKIIFAGPGFILNIIAEASRYFFMLFYLSIFITAIYNLYEKTFIAYHIGYPPVRQ